MKYVFILLFVLLLIILFFMINSKVDRNEGDSSREFAETAKSVEDVGANVSSTPGAPQDSSSISGINISTSRNTSAEGQREAVPCLGFDIDEIETIKNEAVRNVIIGTYEQSDENHCDDYLPGGYIRSTISVLAGNEIEFCRIYKGGVSVVWKTAFTMTDPDKCMFVLDGTPDEDLIKSLNFKSIRFNSSEQHDPSGQFVDGSMIIFDKKYEK